MRSCKSFPHLNKVPTLTYIWISSVIENSVLLKFIHAILNLGTPWYGWNTDNGGVKHQAINPFNSRNIEVVICIILVLLKNGTILPDQNDLMSWLWSYCSWIYSYICNQCISPLTLWVRIPLRRSVLDTTLFDKVCQWLAVGRWFPPPIKLTPPWYNWNIVETDVKYHKPHPRYRFVVLYVNLQFVKTQQGLIEYAIHFYS